MTASSSSEPPGDAFQASFPARSDALSGARRSFAAWLGPRTGDEVAGELEVVFSELAANAVDASPGAGDEVTGRAWCDGHELVLDLENRADAAAPDAEGWDLDDPLRTGGRGLVIAQAFVDSIEVSHGPGPRHVVRCRRTLE
jgi:anti-sigma regulatory factor (Ser/Thr protein kinase)